MKDPTTILHTLVIQTNTGKVSALLDPGSDNSIITRKSAERLNLQIHSSSHNFNIQTMTGKSKQQSITTTFKLTPQVELNLFVVDTNLYLNKQQLDLKEAWPTLDNDLYRRVTEHIVEGPIDIVIGIDQLYTKVHDGKTINHPSKGLSLLNTCLGWSIGGSVNNKIEAIACNTSSPPTTSIQEALEYNETEPAIIEQGDSSTEAEIWEGMKKMFHCELSGDEKIKDKTMDENYAEESFKANIKFENGKYMVKPIFKPNFKPMKSNYSIALRKYKGLRSRLAKDPQLDEMYAEAISTLLANDEVERVHERQEEISDPNRYLYYIPHMAVVKLDKLTTKVRPVFNASSKNHGGISLNDNLITR